MSEIDEPNPGTPTEQWWVINGGHFLTALHRAGEGESPELLYVEYYANTNTETMAIGEAAICGDCGSAVMFRCDCTDGGVCR